ncbi:MAG: hypothetical protein HYV02_01670 [Deltaproteobacteria bacterium]|nr:hypothetical protein [Deltaproteobacteria bacterium]
MTTDGGNNIEIAGETDVVGNVAALEHGDIYLVDLSSGSAVLDFSSFPSTAEFQLVVQSTRTVAGSQQVSVSDVAAAIPPSVSKAVALGNTLAVQEYFDAHLREVEASMDADTAVTPVIGAKGVSKAVTVGSTETFRVLSSLTTTSAYTSVSATVRCMTSQIALYLDDEVSTSLTESQLATLCDQFSDALQTEFTVLGDPPDINTDGVIAVLMTKAVNELGGSLGGIVTGFFFGGDLLSRSSSNPASNEREIIFTLVPDPAGTYGVKIPTNFAMDNLLTAVVPHEVQHLLSYSSHVITKKGASETTWLNEALSHLIEDVVGYGQENPSRVELFLASTDDTALIPSGSPGLTERGASYLFLRFLYEQHSNRSNFLNTLVNTTETGVSNVVSSYGGGVEAFDAWDEFLMRWGVALAVTNQNVTSDARYIYNSRVYNSGTGHWQGVCLMCDTEDGRSTALSGPATFSANGATLSLVAGANAVIDLANPATTVTLEAAGADLQGILIRTQ